MSNEHLVTDFSVYSIANTMKLLDIAEQKYPHAPALKLLFDQAVAALAASDMTRSAASLKFNEVVINIIPRRTKLIDDYIDDFERLVFGKEDLDLNALQIAAICDVHLQGVSDSFLHPETDSVHGMKTEDLSAAMSIWLDAVSIFDDVMADEQAAGELDDEADEWQDDAGIAEDENEQPAQTISANGRLYVAGNDDANIAVRAEGLFLAHVFAFEYLDDAAFGFDEKKTKDLKESCNFAFRAIARFVDTDLAIGRRVWAMSEELELKLQRRVDRDAGVPICPSP